MNRILSALIPLAALFLWNRMSAASPAAAPAAAHSNVSSTQLAVTRFLAERLTGARLSEGAIGLIMLVALFFSAVVGYLCHVALQDRAFGPKVNGVLCFFGAAIAVSAWVLIAPKAYAGAPTALLLIGSVGAVALLLLFALVKAAVIVRFDEVASGARPVSWGSKGRPPAHRLNAVASRRRG